MKKINKNNCIAVLMLAVLMFITMLAGWVSPLSVFAETSSYSDVLDDLQKDENFNADDYPLIPNDYSLKVIQVGIGENNNLFVYVYQPFGESKILSATSINISPMMATTVKSYENYKLELVSSDGTLHKYRVVDYPLAPFSDNDIVRFFEISSIYRNFYNVADGGALLSLSHQVTISETAFAVGQLWTVISVDGTLRYQCKEVELLNVTKQFVHFIRYDEGFQWGGIKSCDAHYFAFCCDKPIDRLISADLVFYTQTYKRLEGQNPKLESERLKHSITVDHTMQGHSKKDDWQRLSSVSDFLSESNGRIPSDEADKLRQYDWIINFYETDYERDLGIKDIFISLFVPGGFIWSIVDACTTYGTLVTDVTLMRLEFEYGGQVYDLGVVSDIMTGDPSPSEPDKVDFFDWLLGLGSGSASDGLPTWAIALIIVGVVVVVCIAVSLLIFAIKSKRDG